MVRSHGEWQNVFPSTFFAQKGHASLLPRGTGHECMVNIKYCICRDRGIGYEDVQIKLEILKTKILYQQSSLATGAHHSRTVPTLLQLGSLPLRPKHTLGP